MTSKKDLVEQYLSRVDDQKRDWQRAALKGWIEVINDQPLKQNAFVVMACPGAGKTRFGVMAVCLAYIAAANKNKNLLVVILTSSIAINAEWESAFSGTGLNASRNPCNFNHEVDVRILTYGAKPLAGINNPPPNGKVLLVCDEYHHAEEKHAFGNNVESYNSVRALPVLMLSGTPWRSNGRITLLENKYENGIVKADFKYDYEDDLNNTKRATVPCRFELVDSTVESIGSKYIKMTADEEKDYKSDNQGPPDHDHNLGKHLNMIEVNSNPTIKTILDKFRAELGNVRSAYRCPKLIGLVVAKHIADAKKIHDYVQNVLQLRSELIVSINPDEENTYKHAASQIAKIKKSLSEAHPTDAPDVIVSVGMISEGVNIPHIKVIAYLSPITTLMYLTQVSFRALRRVPVMPAQNDKQYYDHDQSTGLRYAGVFIAPAHPVINYYAARMKSRIINAKFVENPDDGDDTGPGGGPGPDRRPPVIYEVTSGDVNSYYDTYYNDLTKLADELWTYKDYRRFLNDNDALFYDLWTDKMRNEGVAESKAWLEQILEFYRESNFEKVETVDCVVELPTEHGMTYDEKIKHRRSRIQAVVNQIRFSNIKHSNGQQSYCDMPTRKGDKDTVCYTDIHRRIQNRYFNGRRVCQLSMSELDLYLKVAQEALRQGTMNPIVEGL